MWIINRIQTPTRLGWHCILKDDGWQEFVHAQHYGSGALEDWRESPATLENSCHFYEAWTYDVSDAVYDSLVKQADWTFND